MDHPCEVDAWRKKAAITHLQEVLERGGIKLPLSGAERIANLAFEHTNPVKDLFVVAAANGKCEDLLDGVWLSAPSPLSKSNNVCSRSAIYSSTSGRKQVRV